MKNDIAIKVSGLGKKYTIGKAKDGSLRSTLSGIFKSAAAKGDDFWALKNVDFEIKKGEVVGIIGKNGAGKSTLLKVLSQITKPTEGRIEINGRVASLLEVGTGFHPELTGRENIFLNGTILGMSRKEVKAKFDEIVEFSGVQKFIDTPVKHYSSGMYVRLAFAVAAHLEPEILIIDEVLAVGDAEFQKKCLGKMEDVAKKGRTVIFVSHNMAAIQSLCDRGVVINQGDLKFDGKIVEALNEYKKFGKRLISDQKLSNGFIQFNNLTTQPTTGQYSTISSGVTFSLNFKNLTSKNNLAVTIELINKDDVVVFHHGKWLEKEMNSVVGEYHLEGELPSHFLNSGTYRFNVIIATSLHNVLFRINDISEFKIENETLEGNNSVLPGITRPQINYTINKPASKS